MFSLGWRWRRIRFDSISNDSTKIQNCKFEKLPRRWWQIFTYVQCWKFAYPGLCLGLIILSRGIVWSHHHGSYLVIWCLWITFYKVSDFGHSRDERFSGRSSLPPRRSHRHSPVSPGIMDSPTGSPTHDQSHQLIQRACTQPDLASYGLRIQTRQSVPSDLKYRSDPRQSPRSSLPYDRQYDSSSSPQRQLVPRVSAPARGHFSIGKCATII